MQDRLKSLRLCEHLLTCRLRFRKFRVLFALVAVLPIHVVDPILVEV